MDYKMIGMSNPFNTVKKRQSYQFMKKQYEIFQKYERQYNYSKTQYETAKKHFEQVMAENTIDQSKKN